MFYRIKSKIRMLKLKILIRVFFCWFILSFFVADIAWVRNQINHHYEITDSWTYIHEVSWSILLYNLGQRLMLGCIIYYGILYTFGKYLRKSYSRFLLSFLLFGIILPMYFSFPEVKKYLSNTYTLDIYLFGIVEYITGAILVPFIDKILNRYTGAITWEKIALINTGRKMSGKKIFFNIIRFISCWIIPAFITGSLMYLFNFYRFSDGLTNVKVDSWYYDIRTTMFLFFFVSVYYFIYLWLINFLLTKSKNHKAKILIWGGLFGIGMLFLPFVWGSMGLAQTLLFWLIMSIVGLMVPLTDSIIMFLNKKEKQVPVK